MKCLTMLLAVASMGISTRAAEPPKSDSPLRLDKSGLQLRAGDVARELRAMVPNKFKFQIPPVNPMRSNGSISLGGVFPSPNFGLTPAPQSQSQTPDQHWRTGSYNGTQGLVRTAIFHITDHLVQDDSTGKMFLHRDNVSVILPLDVTTAAPKKP